MKNIESYKHKAAKETLAGWLSSKYETRTEVPFYNGDKIDFVPDVVCYDNGYPFAIYEVVHKSDITGKKLGLIQYWQYVNATTLQVYTIDAEWILTRIKQPNKLKLIDFTSI